MTAISWDDIGERFYENGVSRGVFYGQDGLGVPWNGLTLVEESRVDTADPLYFDGLKFGDLVTLGDFEGKMKAFTYPEEFLFYEGLAPADPGIFLTAQTKMRFGMSWRTEINNDLGQSIGYKLHLLYNVLAIPAQKTYETLSLDNEPIDFEWEITAVPEEVDNFRPTAYMVIDTRMADPFLVTDIENIIYGNSENDPTLPHMNAFVTFINKWGRLIITDHGDGTWSADSPIPGVITMLDETTFEIVSDTAVYIDPPDNETYEISSSDEVEVP